MKTRKAYFGLHFIKLSRKKNILNVGFSHLSPRGTSQSESVSLRCLNKSFLLNELAISHFYYSPHKLVYW